MFKKKVTVTGRLSITDSFLCTDKILVHFLSKNLYNTDPL